MRLKKHLFKRSPHREQASSDVFNRASNNLTFLVNVIVAGIFTPVIFVTSLASTDIILMLANILLSIGYVADFIHRCFAKEVSMSEFIVTLSAISCTLGLTLYLLSLPATISAIGALVIVNHVATAINGFFLIRDVVVPPFKGIIEEVAQYFQIHIGGNFFHQKRLSAADDRFVVDRLFRSYYKHDITVSMDVPSELRPFNLLLKKLIFYVNKYEEPFLGSVINKQKISSTKTLINQLSIDGEAVNSLKFIGKKIDFKRTKLAILEEAKADVKSVTPKDTNNAFLSKLKFFGLSKSDAKKTKRGEVCQKAIEQLDIEIARQQRKIDSLQACLPRGNV